MFLFAVLECVGYLVEIGVSIAKYQQPRLVRVALVVELELVVVVEIVAPADFAVGVEIGVVFVAAADFDSVRPVPVAAVVEIGVVVAAVELETFVVVEGGPL